MCPDDSTPQSVPQPETPRSGSLESQVQKLRQQGLLRTLQPFDTTAGQTTHNDQPLLNFSSNDYLDLANDSRVKQAAIDGVTKAGCGGVASRLMCGTLVEHEQLEAGLSELTGGESALTFGSGFLTNLGVLTALAGRDTVLFTDRLNHASLVDGAQLSRARVCRYNHVDMDHLARLLTQHAPAARKIIVSDSVFSMDGDIAPVETLAELAAAHDAILVIDEAHAIGVFGCRGAGVCKQLGVQPDILVGTLSKSLGSYGGFAVCSRVLREVLINRARSFIYTTALPPACITAATRAIEIIRSEPQLGPRLLAQASQLGEQLTEAGFSVGDVTSQIIPIHIGDNQQSLDIAGQLMDCGILVTAVRPPTVPAGTARLRLSVTLAHTTDDFAKLIQPLQRIAKKAGIL